MSSGSLEGKDIAESVGSLSYPETSAMFVYNHPDALMFDIGVHMWLHLKH